MLPYKRLGCCAYPCKFVLKKLTETRHQQNTLRHKLQFVSDTLSDHLAYQALIVLFLLHVVQSLIVNANSAQLTYALPAQLQYQLLYQRSDINV